MRSLARLNSLFLLAALLPAANSAAASRQFPYEAVVRTAEVEVRSGPGQRYYVTSRLRMNDKVTVHRHDPGGWYMIAPPPGSFSWIDASLVRRTEGDRGVVEVSASGLGPATRAIVRIGSEFSNDHAYYGRELATGDEVTILGEATLQTDTGAMRMFRIAPPSLEYRWVKGDFIVPPGEAVANNAAFPVTSALFTTDAAPASEIRRDSSLIGTSYETERRPRPATPSPAWEPPVSSADHRSKLRMAEIDQKYLEMTRLPPAQWDLDSLRKEYENLRPQADGGLRLQIDRRLTAIESRSRIANEWREFLDLTTATTQRDIELMSMQTVQPAGQQPAPGMVPGGMPTLGPQGLAASAPDMAQPFPGQSVPRPAPLTAPPAAAPNGFPADPEQASPVLPELDGAGIVQRRPSNRRGYMSYVLTDQQGRVLAVLQPAGNVNLEAFVGRSAGVIGQRTHYPQQGTDIINVQQILPVQLSPAQ